MWQHTPKIHYFHHFLADFLKTLVLDPRAEYELDPEPVGRALSHSQDEEGKPSL